MLACTKDASQTRVHIIYQTSRSSTEHETVFLVKIMIVLTKNTDPRPVELHEV